MDSKPHAPTHASTHTHAWIALINVTFALVILTGCNFMGSTPAPTPTPAPIQFTTLNLGLPAEALNAPVTGNVPDDQVLHVNITLKIDQATLDQLSKSNTAKTGTSAGNIASKFGISDDNLKKIQSYFGLEHINVQPNKTRTNLTFDAKAGSVARLLQTKFVTHQLNSRTYYTPDPKQMPRVPSSIAGYILAVTGLDNYSMPPQLHRTTPQPSAQMATIKKGSADCISSLPASAATPRRIAGAYGYDKLWNQGWHGENMTVIFVEMDGVNADDVNNYMACVNAQNKIDLVNMGSSSPAPGGETTLDMEMVAGLAPEAHMIDYQMDPVKIENDWWTGFNEALQQILADNQNSQSPTVLSISMGGPETHVSMDALLAVDQSLRLLTTTEHITVFIASGDCGAFTSRTYGQLSVAAPANDPWVVAVGGTQLDAPSGVRNGEVVWSDGSDTSACHNAWGSGGGVSLFFDKQSFQEGPGVNNQYSTGKRQIPDVSAVAINIPIYDQGQWAGVGGTSAAAPIWAAGLTLVNQGLVTKKGAYYYGPAIFYAIANNAGGLRPYYDVTSGDNLYYKATSGWDYTTGLGTPNLPDFYTILANAASS